MFRELRASAGLFLFFLLLTGFGYPFLITGIGQTLFPAQANGSLIEQDGKIIGSSLIGQNFSGDSYFHPRPSAAGDKGYDAANSSGSNLGPTSDDIKKTVGDRVMDLKKTQNTLPIPVDLVTASASGLDPHISPAAAYFQVPRIAAARNIPESKIEQLVTDHTEARNFGILGENRVNVLDLNRALDHLTPVATAPAQ